MARVGLACCPADAGVDKGIIAKVAEVASKKVTRIVCKALELIIYRLATTISQTSSPFDAHSSSQALSCSPCRTLRVPFKRPTVK